MSIFGYPWPRLSLKLSRSFLPAPQVFFRLPVSSLRIFFSASCFFRDGLILFCVLLMQPYLSAGFLSPPNDHITPVTTGNCATDQKSRSSDKAAINSTQNKIRPSRRSTKLKRNPKRRNRKPKKNLRRQGRNERESFNESRGQGSEDRHHRGWSWLATVHDVVVANARSAAFGSANTKTKAEVDMSGAKPWRQKGTGRARAGYVASPIWREAASVFGPKPRDYSKKVSKSVRRLALQKALERANQSRRRPDD